MTTLHDHAVALPHRDLEKNSPPFDRHHFCIGDNQTAGEGGGQVIDFDARSHRCLALFAKRQDSQMAGDLEITDKERCADDLDTDIAHRRGGMVRTRRDLMAVAEVEGDRPHGFTGEKGGGRIGPS